MSDIRDISGLIREQQATITGLQSQLAEIHDQQRHIMDESCGDERHCTCVPILKREVQRLKGELLQEEDRWQERAIDFHESGGCPECFATDELGHHNGCSISQLEADLAECRRLLRYVLDRAHRNAGNDDNPFTYIWKRDWDEFEQAARAAGGDDANDAI